MCTEELLLPLVYAVKTAVKSGYLNETVSKEKTKTNEQVNSATTVLINQSKESCLIPTVCVHVDSNTNAMTHKTKFRYLTFT